MLVLDIHSQGNIREHIAHLQAMLGDMTEPLASIGMELESRISARFESRTDPSGDPWEPWAESTAASYPDDANGRLLDRYGDMLGSLSHQVTATSVTVGFGQPVATYHEWGTKHMPRRGLLWADPDLETLSEEDEAAVLEILSAWMV